MAEHPSSADLEQFVAGGLPAAADFERHVSGCDTCAHALQREAHVQLVAEAAAHQMRARRDWLAGWRGPSYMMGAAMALAASVFLLFHTVSAHAADADIRRNADDVHGQPFAVATPDAGFGGTFLAWSDAGPVRASDL